MEKKSCSCDAGKPGKVCPLQSGDLLPPYWCEVCQRRVDEKRCPFCGLKARKVQSGGSCGSLP